MKGHNLKKWIIIFLSILILSAPVYGADPWSNTDIAMATTAIASLAIDWRQTKQISSHPDRWSEANPILGRHPSNNQVDLYFAGSTVVLITIANFLPSNWRKVLLGGIIIGESKSIINNIGNGISIRW
jgi:hypothetical protein